MFIPINDNHVRIFGSLMRELKGMKVLAIGLDKYKHEKAEETLRELGIPFKSIQRYKIERAQYIIVKEKPSIVIVGNDMDPLTSSFVKVANSMGVPTLLVQDGVISRRAFERLINPSYIRRVITRLLREKGRGYILKRGIQRALRRVVGRPEFTAYGRGDCTKIAVWGNFAKETLVKEGVAPERIVITGNPRLDSAYRKKFNRWEVYRKLKVSGNKKIAVLATSGLVEAGLWDEKEIGALVRAAANAVKQFPGFQLVIKPHPRESIQDYKKYLPEKEADKVPVIKDIDLYGLISACELLMTEVSTVALDAVAFGKPVIVLNLTDRPYPSTPYPQIYVDGGVALEVRKANDLARKMRIALHDLKVNRRLAKNRQKFIREHLFKLDGRAASRVADLIKRMIKESRFGGGS